MAYKAIDAWDLELILRSEVRHTSQVRMKDPGKTVEKQRYPRLPYTQSRIKSEVSRVRSFGSRN